MVLKQTSGGWTAAEGDPAVTSDVGLIDAASQTGLDHPESRPASILFQALLVLAAAMVVGFVVFFVVRAAVSSDSTPDEQAMDLNELPSVGLDPENRDRSESSGENSSRSGSQRDTLEDGIPEEETPVATPTDTDTDTNVEAGTDAADPAAADEAERAATDQTGDGADGWDPDAAEQLTEDAADTADNSPGFGDLLSPIVTTTSTPVGPVTSTPQNPQPPGLPSLPSFPTTAAPAPTTTPTTASPLPEPTSAPPTTSQPTTTPAPTTPTTVSTTIAPSPSPTTDGTTTTTTIASTTTTSIVTATTLAAPPLIVAPVEGSEHTWEDGVEFEVEPTPGAVRYCWTFESASIDVEACGADTTYALPGGEAGVDPGIVIATAEAQDADGAVLQSETITLKIIAGDLIDSPSAGRSYDEGDEVRVDFIEIPTATEHCVTLTQDSVSLPTVCDSDDRVSVLLRSFTDGPVTVRAEVKRGQQIIGLETIEIVYSE